MDRKRKRKLCWQLLLFKLTAVDLGELRDLNLKAWAGDRGS